MIKVYHLTLVSFFSSDIDELVSGTMCEFKEDVVNRMVLSFSSPVYTAAISSGGVIYALSSNQKKLTKFALPNVKPSKVILLLSILCL